MVETIEWTPRGVVMIDQTRLPLHEEYVTCRNYLEVAAAIRDMIIRGAPAIGVAAAMGVAIGVQYASEADLDAQVDAICETLAKTRPTAVNLFWAIDRMKRLYTALRGKPLGEIRERLIQEAQLVRKEDIPHIHQPQRYTSPMRVFGIDCGTEFTGYGVVEMDHTARSPRLTHCAAGTIRLNKKEKTPQRLAQVYAELTALMTLHAPDCVAIEEVFFSANPKSALKLGQVRGVAMLAAATCNLPVSEYSPLTIKSSVTGYGLAAKQQVQFMVTRLLALDGPPESPDAADALAIAICHIHTAQTLQLQGAGR